MTPRALQFGFLLSVPLWALLLTAFLLFPWEGFLSGVIALRWHVAALFGAAFASWLWLP